jgi:hypothetical protein
MNLNKFKQFVLVSNKINSIFKLPKKLFAAHTIKI